MAGQRERQRRLAAAVGAHQGVDAARLDREVDPLENLFVFYGDAEVARDQSTRRHARQS
jgi:hypothetical protein